MDMETYTVEITIKATIEAPGFVDIEDMVYDHFGVGSGGEGVTVTSCEYKLDG